MLQLLVKSTGRMRTNAPAMGLLLMIVVAAEPSICQAGGIVNGGFSTPDISRPGQNAGEPHGLIKFFPPSEVTGWKTTDTAFEIWSDGAAPDGVMRFSAPRGYKQWAEVNANMAGTLSQTVSGIGVGNNFGFSFYHRGRQSATEGDVIQVTVVDTVTNATLLDKQFSTTNAAWQQYKVPMGVKKDDHPLLLSFKAVSSAGGNIGIGNFLTGVELGESFLGSPTGAPTERPGISNLVSWADFTDAAQVDTKTTISLGGGSTVDVLFQRSPNSGTYAAKDLKDLGAGATKLNYDHLNAVSPFGGGVQAITYTVTLTNFVAGSNHVKGLLFVSDVANRLGGVVQFSVTGGSTSSWRKVGDDFANGKDVTPFVWDAGTGALTSVAHAPDAGGIVLDIGSLRQFSQIQFSLKTDGGDGWHYAIGEVYRSPGAGSRQTSQSMATPKSALVGGNVQEPPQVP